MYVCTIKYILMLFKEELTIAFLSALFRPPSPPSSLHMYSTLWNTSLYEEGGFQKWPKDRCGVSLLEDRRKDSTVYIYLKQTTEEKKS